MKKLLYIIAGIMVLGTGAAKAQKVGHVNSQEILFELPGYKDAEAKMKEYQKEMMAEDEKMKAKLQDMINKYNTGKAKMSEAEQKITEQDIVNYQTRLEEFEQDVTTNMQKREQMYMEPLIKQVKDAIAKVAKAQGINYVVDTGTLLYTEGGNDLTALVKKDLMPATVPTTPATPAKTPGTK